MTYRIHAPTAQFEPRKDETGVLRYWPMNELAEQLCDFADCLCVYEVHLKRIEAMRIGVELLKERSIKPSYPHQVTLAVRAVAAYRKRSSEPQHIKDVA